eukprot:scaffold10255_cov248-Ochromonas_danica.AAC.1
MSKHMNADLYIGSMTKPVTGSNVREVATLRYSSHGFHHLGRPLQLHNTVSVHGSLHLSRLSGKHCTDTTLTIIIKHVKSVREYGDGLRLSDKLVSDLIDTCQLLERLKISCYGLESLVSVSKYSSLRFVNSNTVGHANDVGRGPNEMVFLSVQCV